LDLFESGLNLTVSQLGTVRNFKEEDEFESLQILKLKQGSLFCT
jgi:hypothetical protein